MRVVLLIRSLGCGGAERQLVLLATHLAPRHDVSIVTFYPEDNFFHNEIERSSIRLVSLDKRGTWDVIRFTARFVAVIRRLKPDVVYAFMNTAGIVSLSSRFVRPAPRVIWGIRSSNMALREYGLLPRLLRRLEAWLSPLADLVTSNSEAGRVEAIGDGFAGDILVIPNGIDTSRFSHDEDARRRLRGDWGLGESTPLIGIVGRHDPMKGYETFLRAAALYLQVNPCARFLSVGDGDSRYSASLKALADQLGMTSRMIWAGRADDVVPYYSAMDIFTSASSFGEGFSNAIGEAMSCGLPSVVTNVGDSSRIVGDTGWTVPANDPQALRDAWAAALSSPSLSALRHAARQRTIDHYSVGRVVQLTESVLVSVSTGDRVPVPTKR